MKKKIFTFLLSCMMIIGIMPVSIFAEGDEDEGASLAPITSLSFTLSNYEYGKTTNDLKVTLAKENEGQIEWKDEEYGLSSPFTLCTKIGSISDVSSSLVKPNTALEANKTYYIAAVIFPEDDYSADNLTANDIHFSFSDGTKISTTAYYTQTFSDSTIVRVAVAELPVLSDYTEVTIPFQKVVTAGGNKNPGPENFSLDIFWVLNEDQESYKDVKVESSVTTNGTGTFNGTIKISGHEDEVEAYLSEGFVVREKEETKTGWSYSDNMWYVDYPKDDTETLQFYRVYYHADSDEYELDDQPYDTMTFENVYTVNEEPKATATPTSGWDDGGPFTTDTCGNVFDRWGNKIYEANGCNVSGYNLVRTSVED